MISVGSVILWIAIVASLYFVTFWFLVFIGYEQQPEKSKALKKFPFVTITIPAYNEEKRVEKTLLSLTKLNYPKDKFEILVVNDGSTDGTAAVVQKLITQNPQRSIKLINKPKNGGKGSALNLALRKSKGDFFVCMDADSEIDSDALMKMIPRFKDSDVGVVLPLMKINKPRKFIQKLQWYEYLVNMFYKKLMGKLDCIHVSPGPFSVYRKSVLNKVGGFDEDNLTEDLEMTIRLQSKHYKIIQLMDTIVYTDSPKSLGGFYRQRNRWNKGALLNALKYKKMIFNKKFGDFGMFQLPTVVITGVISIILVSNLVYHLVKPVSNFISHLASINYDIGTLLTNMSFNFTILDINIRTIFTMLVVFALSLMIFKSAHKMAGEKVLKHGFFSIVVFLLAYYLLLGAVWASVMFETIIGKKQRW